MQLRVTLITELHGGNDIGKTQAEDARMDKKMTIYTIAEELGVTPTSVSRAFNPNSRLSAAKRKLILEASAKYGFTPNRMASRLSKREITVGVLIYSRFRQFYSELIRGIEDAYEGLKDYKVKCDLRFVDSLEHSALVCNDILDEFARKKYDGVIISDLTSDADIDKINALSEKCGNLVLVNFDSNGIKRLFASIHDIGGAYAFKAEKCSIVYRRHHRVYSDEGSECLLRRSRKLRNECKGHIQCKRVFVSSVKGRQGGGVGPSPRNGRGVCILRKLNGDSCIYKRERPVGQAHNRHLRSLPRADRIHKVGRYYRDGISEFLYAGENGVRTPLRAHIKRDRDPFGGLHKF